VRSPDYDGIRYGGPPPRGRGGRCSTGAWRSTLDLGGNQEPPFQPARDPTPPAAERLSREDPPSRDTRLAAAARGLYANPELFALPRGPAQLRTARFFEYRAFLPNESRLSGRRPARHAHKHLPNLNAGREGGVSAPRARPLEALVRRRTASNGLPEGQPRPPSAAHQRG
jgi:hypothetical protein